MVQSFLETLQLIFKMLTIVPPSSSTICTHLWEIEQEPLKDGYHTACGNSGQVEEQDEFWSCGQVQDLEVERQEKKEENKEIQEEFMQQRKRGEQ